MATIGLALLPVMVALFSLLRPTPWTIVWLFPVAHLPVLVNEPELTGPLVYTGVEGLLALVLAICLGGVWTVSGLRLSVAQRGERGGSVPRSPLPWFTGLSALAIWVAFVWPVFDAAQAGRFQAAAVVLGIAFVVIVVVSGRWVTQELGDFYGHAPRRRRWIVSLLREPQPRPGRLSAALAISLVGSLMVITLFR